MNEPSIALITNAQSWRISSICRRSRIVSAQLFSKPLANVFWCWIPFSSSVAPLWLISFSNLYLKCYSDHILNFYSSQKSLLFDWEIGAWLWATEGRTKEYLMSYDSYKPIKFELYSNNQKWPVINFLTHVDWY